MELEEYEKKPARKWYQLTRSEQQQELTIIHKSHYFRLLSKRMQAMIRLLL